MHQQLPRTSPTRTTGWRARATAFAAIGILAVGAAACGSDDDDVDDTILPSDTISTGPLPTVAGSGPLDSFETDTSSDESDGTILGDPMEPSTNDSTVIPDVTGP